MRMLQKSMPTYTTGRLVQRSFASKWLWLILLLVPSTIMGAFGWLKTHQVAPKPADQKAVPVLTVTTQPARWETASAHVVLTGSVGAIDPLTIGSEASGLSIVSVPVDEGDYVQRGQVLAVLDSSLLRAQLAAAKARLAAANASTSKAIQPNRPEDIVAAEQAYQQAQSQAGQQAALLQQARANFENARRAAQRYQTLVSQGAISQQDADNQMNAARTAQAQVQAQAATVAAAKMAANQAKEHMLLAQKGGSAEDVSIARANAAESAAQVEQLEVQIAQTVIRAPDAGLITKRDAHLGDIAAGGKSLFEMVRNGKLELQAQCTQQDLIRLRVGDTATVTDGSRRAAGTVWKLAPTVDPSTRLGTVRIGLPLQSGFMPGMFARGQVNVGTRQIVTVPNSAVLNDGTNAYVFTYWQGLARKRVVTTGDHFGARTEIASGLNAGEPVIVAGAGFLNDGDAVQVGN